MQDGFLSWAENVGEERIPVGNEIPVFQPEASRFTEISRLIHSDAIIGGCYIGVIHNSVICFYAYC
jgi:hypothetical protein